jgi:hypothetical protein
MAVISGELLWVYEGLTNYLGDIMPARSGLLRVGRSIHLAPTVHADLGGDFMRTGARAACKGQSQPDYTGRTAVRRR